MVATKKEFREILNSKYIFHYITLRYNHIKLLGKKSICAKFQLWMGNESTLTFNMKQNRIFIRHVIFSKLVIYTNYTFYVIVMNY